MKRFVRLPQVLEAVGVAERTLYLWMAQGKFPKPIKIGHMSVWLESEVESWQEALISAREQESVDAPRLAA